MCIWALSMVMDNGELFNVLVKQKATSLKRTNPESSFCSHKRLIATTWKSSSFLLLCSLIWRQTNNKADSLSWYAEFSSQKSILSILPTPLSLLSSWYPIAGHGGSIYTKETGKCYKLGLFSFLGESVVKHLLAQCCLSLMVLFWQQCFSSLLYSQQ